MNESGTIWTRIKRSVVAFAQNSPCETCRSQARL